MRVDQSDSITCASQAPGELTAHACTSSTAQHGMPSRRADRRDSDSVPLQASLLRNHLCCNTLPFQTLIAGRPGQFCLEVVQLPGIIAGKSGWAHAGCTHTFFEVPRPLPKTWEKAVPLRCSWDLSPNSAAQHAVDVGVDCEPRLGLQGRRRAESIKVGTASDMMGHRPASLLPLRRAKPWIVATAVCSAAGVAVHHNRDKLRVALRCDQIGAHADAGVAASM